MMELFDEENAYTALAEQETDILCAYYGLQTKRLTVKKIAEKHH